MDELCDLLRALVEAPGVSGFEEPIRSTITRLLREAGIVDVEVDVLGNLIARVGEGYPRVALMAHMDEVGLIVKYVNDKGFAFFEAIGGLDARSILGQVVVVYGSGPRLSGKSVEERRLYGVVGLKPVHVLTEEEKRRVPSVKELFIDLGFKDKGEALEYVRPGDPGHPHKSFTRVPGPWSPLVSCRALDDRAGCASLIRAAQLLVEGEAKASCYLVFTSQEEVGLRGARTVAYTLHERGVRDLIVVDVTHAAGYPGFELKENPVELGRGPAVSLGPPVDTGLSRRLIEVAEEEGIPYQVEPSTGRTRTDLDVAQLARTGLRTTLVSVPLRYMHTTGEMVSLDDVENTAKLLSVIVRRLGT